MPRRKQEQPKRLPYSHGNEEAGEELGEEEDWFGNASETPSEVSYLDVQEDLNVSPGKKLQEQETSPDNSSGCTTPIRNALELLISENDQVGDIVGKQDVLSPVSSPLLHEMGSPVLPKPISSNLRRLLEAGPVSGSSGLGVKEKEGSADGLVSALPLSPSSPHALQLSVLARKLAAKQEQSNNFSPSNSFMWDQDIWLQSSSSCSLSPASATQKLKAAANAVRLDKSLSRVEEPMRFSPYSSAYSPIQKQSASSALAALSKKVSERSQSSQDQKRPGSSFLSLASMTSSAALLKEVAARAAGNMMVERKDQLIPGDTLKSMEVKQEKVIPSAPLELLLAAPKQKSLKPANQAANQKGPLIPKIKVKDEPKERTTPDPIQSPRSGNFIGNEIPAKILSEVPPASELFNQDMSCKVASELLFKLSAENKKEQGTQAITIKEEPMELEIPDPALPRLPNLSFNCKAVKSERSQNSPEVVPLTEIKLFTQDISVKMASELLYQLSEKVSKAQEQGKEASELSSSNSSCEEVFRQSPFVSNLRDSLSNLHARPSSQESGKLPIESGTVNPPWKFCEQVFPCKVCGKVFGRQQTLSRHLSLHTEERRYKCHLCPYAAKCRANLNQHLTIHSVKLVSGDSEEIATAVTSNRCDRKNSPYYYSCHVCGFETEVNLQFVSHMSLHVDKEQWMFSLCCNTCNFSCMDETEMKAHIHATHADDKVQTPSCHSPSSESKAATTFSSSSSSSSSLSSSSALCDSVIEPETPHSDVTTEEQSSSFNPAVLLTGSSTSGSEEKNDKGFECIFCNFVCKTKMMYERHLQIHLITRMYECDICHKFLKTSEQLLEHKKCHNVSTGGLKCPFCVYATNRPSAMECHLRTHYKMEFKCRICQVVKANQLELEIHIREHRLGNHYKCDQCGYLSKTANKLIEHVRVHTGERPFHCDQCSYSCKRKDNLNLHKKLKHSPRQTLCCEECFFTTTHPFVFSRHVKKHQNGEYLEGEKKAQPVPGKESNSVLNRGSPRKLLSPLSVMSASQALQSVALSVTGKNGISTGSFGLFGLNGISAHLSKYRNCDLTHLIPLTTLFPQNKCETTFHSSQQQTAPADTVSPKNSFLAYLGLTEQTNPV
ncbi:zinc finger protein 827 isoform X4 [Hypanus sabinus]|uniref:zinc finger protein 827 isoform X4 n=1 Tax=Hypanus sabinus TaxID=79690 RepID=UPI0028C4E4B6|nr:zinc finger protein 827 isoform X4 [Hypanus sabinus]